MARIRTKVARTLFGPTSTADNLHLPDILRQETVGGFLMLAATVAALVWANVAPEHYHDVAHLKLGPLDLSHWASEGLLTLFFFVAGLELKRELTEGALAKPANALVPIVAALAGIAVPAGIYLGVNLAMPGGDVDGWAIPVATDIAFALAVLAIVGSHLPSALRSFLLTMAIVDDICAVLIIAIFFSKDLSFPHLIGAVLCIALWWLLMRNRREAWWIYLPLALVTWWLTLQSGIHATIAGVTMGALVYANAEDPHDILDRWEHALTPISAGVAVPIFALFAAGVHLEPDHLIDLVTSPISIGIIAGLVVGKLVGVFFGAFATGAAIGAKPEGSRWREVAGVAQMAGIGFTVSLLIVDLAFAGNDELVAQGKAAVLVASLLAAVLGSILLGQRNAVHREAARRSAAEQASGDETH